MPYQGSSETYYNNGQMYNFYLTHVEASPVPEPSTWAMMLLGFAGLGFAAYRRRLIGEQLPSASGGRSRLKPTTSNSGRPELSARRCKSSRD